MTDILSGPGTSPQQVQGLDLSVLPRGAVSRLAVELTHNAMGAPVHVPVLVATGHRPGPVFGITAAVHGNELNGIPVIHRLFERLQPRSLKGSIVGVVVANVPGFLLAQREYSDGVDLNRVMPGRPDGGTAALYVHRLLSRIIDRFDFLVDLHTASFGRINSLYVRADLEDRTAGRMASLMRPQIIIHNPPSDQTLRGAAAERGIPAITTEIGNPHGFNRDYIRRSLAGLRAILAEIGMLGRRQTAEGKPPIVCRRSYWLYSDHGGLLEVYPDVVTRVGPGDVVAHLRTAYGDLLREYRAPQAGVVVGKSVHPVGPSGSRILHLGVDLQGDADAAPPADAAPNASGG